MKTIIQTRIDGDQFAATSPHVPTLEGKGPTEAKAINMLMAQIRAYRLQYESVGEPVPWASNVTASDESEFITHHITGLWPAEVVEIDETPEPVEPDENERD